MANRKSVLVAIPCLMLGGTEYQTLYLVKALGDSGYDVTVLCYFEYDDTMVRYMREAGVKVLLMTPGGTRPAKLTQIFTALSAGFRKALADTRPDVVHVQYMAPGSLAILLFRLLGVKKIVATAHVPGHIYRRKWIPRLIAQYLTTAFLCVSKSSEEAFFDEKAEEFSREAFRKGRKHFTLYNCIDTESDVESLHESRLTNHVSRITFTLGIVSRLSYEKGIDIMIAALPAIIGKHPDIRLLIVGDGAERERLQAQAKTLGVSEHIEWAGLQPKERLPDFYGQMDIVVIPSRFEGFGLTAIEAMAAGVPVVTSAVDGLGEVMADGKTGLLFESENAEALAEAVTTLLDDDELRERFAAAGAERVRKHFSYNIYKKSLIELYESVAGNDR